MDDKVKKTIATYDVIASDYANKTNDYAPQPEREKFISLIPRGGKILDAGCGPGRDTDYFTKQGFSVVGVDLSEKLLELAKTRTPNATFLKQDLRALDFPDRTFDGIWACASLHHLGRSDVLLVLKTFHRLLKPNATLFILVKEGSGEEDVVESLSSGLPRHYIYFSLEEIRRMQEEAGFIVDDIYTWREEDRRDGRSNLVWVSSFSKKI